MSQAEYNYTKFTDKNYPQDDYSLVVKVNSVTIMGGEFIFQCERLFLKEKSAKIINSFKTYGPELIKNYIFTFHNIPLIEIDQIKLNIEFI